MTTYERIIQLFQENKIEYEEIRHEEVRTSEEAANTRPGIKLSQGAKAMIVKMKNIDNAYQFAMIVLPGDQRFDSKKVKKLFNAKDVRFASEEEVLEITNGVKPGGVPPFGNLFGLEVIVDPRLLENEIIAFNAGDRRISVLMKSTEWMNLVAPRVEEVY